MSQRRWLKPLGWALLGFACGAALLVWNIIDTMRLDLNAIDNAAMVQHLAAQNDLLTQAAQAGCVGNAELASAAERLGWRTEHVAGPGTSAISDPGMASGLRIWIQPMPGFAKSDYMTFDFDVNDCLIPAAG